MYKTIQSQQEVINKLTERLAELSSKVADYDALLRVKPEQATKTDLIVPVTLKREDVHDG